MAPTKTARPGRTLAVFALAIAILYGLIAMGNSWKPGLGLDLQGGTEISMQAENPEGGSVPSESIDEARNIIDQRVNGSGITSARVTTEGGDVIQVSIPGEGRVQKELAERVRQTAKLRFRLVACSSQYPGPCASATSGTSGVEAPGAGSGLTGLQRSGVGFEDPTPGGAASEGASQAPNAEPNGSAAPSDSASATPSGGASQAPAGGKRDAQKVITVEQAVSFMNTLKVDEKAPAGDWANRFAQFQCPPPGEAEDADPGVPLLTCDDQGMKYLLTPAIIEGTEISDADFGIPQGEASYAVFLDFHSRGNEAFADATGAIAGDETKLFAITLDGEVISAATASSRISGGAQITGGFTQESAKALANNLKYGSLPLDFPEENIQTRVIGPSLAGDQLTAGLWAGLIGLLLVIAFAMLYYRAMGLVIIGSLVFAGAITYALIVLLSETAGVTLDLPGIAGLIVGIGMTADSFIILYERIRDEMRDGRSMRVAVDAGWVRARNTAVASDAVQFLAALVLYIFATNEVKGFAFMLGLTTLIDLVVFFWFTYPMTKLFARLRFFNRGHRLSGLDKNAIGMEPSLAGGKA